MASPKPSPKNNIRLQKYLADCGLGSRRFCETLIESGEITVNGVRAAQLGVTVDPEVDSVCFKGRTVQQQTKVYILFNKPREVLCSSRDPQRRRIVLDYISGVPERIYTAGRLDYDSEGLLLLSNDGELVQRLIHPRHHVEKVYWVWSSKAVHSESRQLMKSGIRDESELLKVVDIQEDGGRRKPGMIKYRVTLNQGKKRQIRRMFNACESPVVRLMRIEMGPLKLDGLKQGAWRYLSSEEVAALYGAVDLKTLDKTTG